MEKHKILIVDDDTDINFALKSILESHNYLVESADNKESGMEKAKNFRPDLILLDVNMTSRYEGFEMNKELRKDSSFRNTPVILLTGLDVMTIGQQVQDMYKELNIAVDGKYELIYKEEENRIGFEADNGSGKKEWATSELFISKPVDPALLLNEIKNILS